MAKKPAPKKVAKAKTVKRKAARPKKVEPRVVEGAFTAAVNNDGSAAGQARATRIEEAMAAAIMQAHADGHGSDPKKIKEYILAAIDRERGE